QFRFVKLTPMQDRVHPAVTTVDETDGRWASVLIARVRPEAQTATCIATALICAFLLILSFPDFDLWPLAWVALVPLLFLIARKPMPGRAFLTGWLAGTVFFYGSCYW